MELSESTEMYLETIFLIQKEHGHAHVVDIAETLNITKSSVTNAMNQLKEDGFVNKESYGHITLSKKGEVIAKKVYKKHHSISLFLEETLSLSPNEASINACKMEHIITDSMWEAIKKYLEK